MLAEIFSFLKGIKTHAFLSVATVVLISACASDNRPSGKPTLVYDSQAQSNSKLTGVLKDIDIPATNKKLGKQGKLSMKCAYVVYATDKGLHFHNAFFSRPTVKMVSKNGGVFIKFEDCVRNTVPE